MSVQDCQELVEKTLEDKFPATGDERFATVGPNPDIIFENTKVALWAQSLSGKNVDVDMRLPGRRDFLRTLAAGGAEFTDDYENVRHTILPAKYVTVHS
ncbi:hypothetical protein EDB80DRAFT_725205 [Ilyonectria destructans]|nr:hypothetical protein EDB80DRAFT_725205 [Ilyonectria destructans]